MLDCIFTKFGSIYNQPYNISQMFKISNSRYCTDDMYNISDSQIYSNLSCKLDEFLSDNITNITYIKKDDLHELVNSLGNYDFILTSDDIKYHINEMMYSVMPTVKFITNNYIGKSTIILGNRNDIRYNIKMDKYDNEYSINHIVNVKCDINVKKIILYQTEGEYIKLIRDKRIDKLLE